MIRPPTRRLQLAGSLTHNLGSQSIIAGHSCQVCPMCAYDLDDAAHPMDGLAWCPRCQHEWVCDAKRFFPPIAECLICGHDMQLAIWRDGTNIGVCAGCREQGAANRGPCSPARDCACWAR